MDVSGSLVARSPNLHELIYARLKADVIRGILRAGEVLNETSLSLLFGVSRSPIRDAMQRLLRDGLVTKASNGRYYVTALSQEDLNHLYRVRQALEGMAASLACLEAADEDIDILERLVEKEKMAAGRHDASELLRIGHEFHAAMVAPAGNPFISDLIRMVLERTSPYTTRSAILPSRETDAVQEHEEIIRQFRSRDCAAVRATVEHHIEMGRQRLLAAYADAIHPQPLQANLHNRRPPASSFPEAGVGGSKR